MNTESNTPSGITLEWLQQESHRIAVEHGWWDTERGFGEQIALMHSELSEALEEWRKGSQFRDTYYSTDGSTEPPMKPEGIPIELADAIIRIANTCEHYGIDLTKAILTKIEYNKTRSYRHGNKLA